MWPNRRLARQTNIAAFPRSWRRRASAPAWLVFLMASRALAVTQEDVFRSINENMVQQPDYERLIPWLFGIAGLVVVVIFVRQRQKLAAVPKALNHPGKLMREMSRLAEIDPAEMKKYKALARDKQVENPLTLMLCPSLLGDPAPAAETQEPAQAQPPLPPDDPT